MKKFVSLSLAVCAAIAVAHPSAASTLTVNAGGNLQAALNAARPGDTILLAAGATFTGTFTLPAKNGVTDITVRSSAADASLPPPGVRLTAAYASLLPKLRSTSNGPVLRTAPGASHWRLLFLEFLPVPGTTTADLVDLGDASSAQNTVSAVPHDLTVDRCYFHGDPTAGQRRGIALNSADTQILNSTFLDFKGVNQDTQAIAGWNGPGPFLIENNDLQAAGEVVLFGGSDPHVVGLIPSDITIRHNTLSRPMAWEGQKWTVKNLLEFKNAQRVLVEGNILENHWVGGQQGSAIVLTPRNQGHTAPWTVVRDITIQNNVVRHVASAFNILGYDNLATSEQTQNITIHNNLLYDVNTGYGPAATPGPARFLLIGAGPKNITIDHNTVDNNGASTVFFYGGATPTGIVIEGFQLTNNLLRSNSWALYGDAVGDGTAALTKYAPHALVLHNTFAGASPKRYPVGNDFPSLAQWLADFVARASGDYHLAPASLSAGAASDGKDIGVDYAELTSALSGTPSTTPVPPPVVVPPVITPPVVVPPVVTPPVVTPPVVATSVSTPYGGTPAAVPGRVQAEAYDVGGEGVAYHDSTRGNAGHILRSNSVDLQRTTDAGNGYDVAWVVAGEWLKYTVSVKTAGTYTLDVRVASLRPGGVFHVEIDGANVTGALRVPDTGGWQRWTTISKSGVALARGTHVVRLVMDGNGSRGFVGNFNWFAFR